VLKTKVESLLVSNTDFNLFPIIMAGPFVVFGYGSLIFKVSGATLTDAEPDG